MGDIGVHPPDLQTQYTTVIRAVKDNNSNYAQCTNP
jgi:hypothetical protein